MKHEFFQTFIANLPSKATVVDLGAGSGKHATILANRGMKVLAVDKISPSKIPAGMKFIVSDIPKWLSTLSANELFDGIWMKNIIQFFEKPWVTKTLMPTLRRHLTKGGVIAIETFRREPSPPFQTQHRSYYSAQELRELFSDEEIILSEETDEEGKDMQENARTFALTRILVKNT